VAGLMTSSGASPESTELPEPAPAHFFSLISMGIMDAGILTSLGLGMTQEFTCNN
jgi:hypothetical protein